MAETFYDSSADPFNSDAFSYYHLQSTGYSGSWDPITCPAAANYPVSGVATRLLVSLPMRVDQSDLAGTRPIALKIGATTLTRVTAAPGANEYRLCPSTSERTDTIELNATRIGATLDFDYYGTGSIINGSDINNIWHQTRYEAGTLYDNTTTDPYYEIVLRDTTKKIYKVIGNATKTATGTLCYPGIIIKSGGSYITGANYEQLTRVAYYGGATPYWAKEDAGSKNYIYPMGYNEYLSDSILSIYFEATIQFIGNTISINGIASNPPAGSYYIFAGNITGVTPTSIDAIKIVYKSGNATAITIDTTHSYFKALAIE